MPHPNAEEILARGSRATALMADETFLSVVDELSHFHLAALVAAPPGDSGREAREHHHLMHYALNEIAAELSQRAQTADELLQHIKAEEDNDE